MFNIKSIVKQITERSKDSSTESTATSDSLLCKTEGFLCPKCMKQLPSAWELQSHYEAFHDVDTADVSAQPLPGIPSSVKYQGEDSEQCDVQQDAFGYGEKASSSLAVEDVLQLTDVCDLQERLQQALARRSALESRVFRLVQSNVSLKNAVDDMDQELSHLRERHTILEAQLAHRESIDDAAVLRQELIQVQRVMDEVNRERERERDDLQAKLQQFQERESDSLIGTLQCSLRIKEQECRELHEKLEELQTNICCVTSGSKNNVISTVCPENATENKQDTLVNDLNEEVKKLSEEKSLIESELRISLKEYSIAQRTLTDLQQSSLELQHEHQNMQLEHEQELENLRITMQEKCDLLQKQEDAVQLLVSERAELVRQLELMDTEKLRECKESNRRLEKLQNELSRNADIQKHLEDCLLSETMKSRSLQDQLDTVTESTSTTIQKKSEEIKTLRAAFDEATGEKLVLEAKLEATGSEHQKLLERCYTSTNEIESLKVSVAALRRKWEESESALQDLGRENATLQLDIEKLLARKWTEDADVTQCTLCLREFTMLLRKHHCRNCGQIFCNECSSKTAPVVSNKKPVRVCDSCYTELRTK